jgi:hypothetical protein
MKLKDIVFTAFRFRGFDREGFQGSDSANRDFQPVGGTKLAFSQMRKDRKLSIVRRVRAVWKHDSKNTAVGDEIRLHSSTSLL